MKPTILSALFMGTAIILSGCNDNQTDSEKAIQPEVQQVLSQHLDSAADKYHTKSVVGIIIESDTGNIIAQINPDNATELYPFGSMFKIFNTALAIENGLTANEYVINKPYNLTNSSGEVLLTVTDVPSFKPFSEKMTPADILVNSCNVGSAQIALDLPTGAQKNLFDSLHFNEILSVDTSQTKRPILPTDWNQVDCATTSFGANIYVSPLHMIAGVNAMINDGIYVRPNAYKRKDAKKTERVINHKTSAELRTLMSKISENASGKNASVEGIQIATLTSSTTKNPNGHMLKDELVTACVTVFPTQKPKYTMLIVFEEPQGTKDSFGLRTSTWNVVPVSGQILNDIVPVLIKQMPQDIAARLFQEAE